MNKNEKQQQKVKKDIIKIAKNEEKNSNFIYDKTKIVRGSKKRFKKPKEKKQAPEKETATPTGKSA